MWPGRRMKSLYVRPSRHPKSSEALCPSKGRSGGDLVSRAGFPSKAWLAASIFSNGCLLHFRMENLWITTRRLGVLHPADFAASWPLWAAVRLGAVRLDASPFWTVRIRLDGRSNLSDIRRFSQPTGDQHGREDALVRARTVPVNHFSCKYLRRLSPKHNFTTLEIKQISP